MGKSKKAKKAKAPKKLAGMRIPRILRSSTLGKWLLTDPVGRTVLGDVLVAAAGAAAASLARHAPGATAVRQTADSVAETGSDVAHAAAETVKSAIGKVGHAAAEVAGKVLPGHHDDDATPTGGAPRSPDGRRRESDRPRH